MITVNRLFTWFNTLRSKRGFLPLKNTKPIYSYLHKDECPYRLRKLRNKKRKRRYIEFDESLAKMYLRCRLNDRKFEPNYKCHVFGSVDELADGFITVNDAAAKYGVKLTTLQFYVTQYYLKAKVHPVSRRNMVKETDLLEWLKTYRPRKHKYEHP